MLTDKEVGIRRIPAYTLHYTTATSEYRHLNITFMHLADTFIQSDLQCIQVIHLFDQYACSLGIEHTTFCAANAMLYH